MNKIPTAWTETLPDDLPANPLQIVAKWLAEARSDAAQPNPNAMVLATVDARGWPSARVVLCKDIAVDAGYIAFYTNYQSRKGRELSRNPQAAIVFHWDHRHRQVRAEGRVEPLALTQAVSAAARRFGIPYEGPGSREPDAVAVDIPRPDYWGGFRLNVHAVELWVEGDFRIHDRARWTRATDGPADPSSPLPWSATRLQP